MRRVPVDSDFGSPIVVLRNSEVVVFENGTIGEIWEEDDVNELLKKPYQFYYNHVNEVSSLKLNSPDAITNKTQLLENPKFKLSITVIFGLILTLAYFNSFYFAKLLSTNSIRYEFQLAILIAVFILCIGFEDFLYRYYTKNKFTRRSLQLQLIHRTEPKIILESNYSNWLELFEIHNASSRFAIIVGCLSIPEIKDFDSDFILFLKLFILCNSFFYIVILSFSPFLMNSYVYKKWRQKGYKRVKELDFESFFTFAKKQIEQSRPDSNLVNSSTLSELISGDETHMKEFKGSIWTAYNSKTYERIETQTKKRLDLQDAIVKSVASFLNTDGGVLLIGVKDKPHQKDKPIVGIENDFNWVKDKDIEGYRHALIQLLNDAFGDQSTVKLYLKISYPSINDKLICRIDVKPLPRVRNGELWVKTQTLGDEEFFYRVSDTSTHASAKSANRYIRHHFEGFSVNEEHDD